MDRTHRRSHWMVWGLAVAVALAVTAAAPADILGFVGNLTGSQGPYGDFVGTWTIAEIGPSDIDHIVVTQSGSGPVRIQVFGQCENRICNWGALPARGRSDSPNSEAVRSLSADFNLGFALRHITLHRIAGGMLRFDMVTEFTDGSVRHDYETAGRLAMAGAKPAGSAAQTASPAAAAPSAEASMPVAATIAAGTDDCVSIDTGHLYVVADGSNWKLRDFLHVVQNFGPYRAAANKGQSVLSFYRMDEFCRVGRGSSNMSFLRSAGEVPRVAMKGEDCTEVNADKVSAAKQGDDWNVVDGSREIYNYGSDQAGANQAAGIIRTLHMSRQCFYDRANSSASYWLSR